MNSKQLSFKLRFSLYDFMSKFSGSAFGAIWAIAEPLITVLIYRFVYTVAFGREEIDGIPYYLWLSAGIAFWFFFSDGLKSVCSVYRDYSYIIKKISLNKKALPSVRALSSLYSHLLFMAVVVTLCYINCIYIKNAFGLLAGVVICYIFTLLLGKILAILCGHIKDTSHILSIVLNILFWLTPIFWNINDLPENAKTVVELNPATILTEIYRNGFFYGGFISADKFLYLIGISIVMFAAAYILESKYLPDISDKL